ncbi:GAF domain-containing protein [Methylobacterium sp. C25]|uniref:GAF domain-containing protein n=1 Tax=Methylobacterium sp. C25 TaxID=2721622 RepID=UPI002D7EDDA9|nr:GAF domain-containing protein [Methylobacterium sp. C25]
MTTYERLVAAQTLDGVVTALRQTARRVLGSDGIAVVLRDNGFSHYVAEDAIQPLWRGQRFPLETCVSGWAMLNNETVVAEDIRRDPRVPVLPYQNKAICSLLMVPIGSPEPIAALGAYWCAMVHIHDDLVARAEALAHQAATVIARIQRSDMNQICYPEM